MMKTPGLSQVERWRLMLGEAAENGLYGGSGQSMNPQVQAMDRALSWLYGRDEGDGNASDTRDRHGGDGASVLNTPAWINTIHTLFPRETIERLERDALERYGIEDLVTNIEVLERAMPNPALLEAVMRTKHLMNPDVLAMARQLVRKVVQQIMEKLASEIQRAFSGSPKRQRVVPGGAASQFAARESIRRNLRHYDVEKRRMILAQPWFYHNTRRTLERWQIILVVDQSGSMLSSVIHSAVTASCLWALPGVKTHLLIFDTQVVDLSDSVDDPVDVLMRVQLGGGTDIARAMRYAASLIEVPSRSIVVLVSDFYEGGSTWQLISLIREMAGQGTKVLGLGALNDQAEADFDRQTAAQMVEAGAHVAAMTPGQLAAWLAEKLG